MAWPQGGRVPSRPAAWLMPAALFLAGLAGCAAGLQPTGRLEKVWARRGFSDGRFQKPRAMAIDPQDRIYVVDMTARIQVFDPQGNFLRAWRTPAWEAGKPAGISIAPGGELLVADTHYFRVLVYSPEGALLRTLGGTFGQQPGQFGLVTDVVQDAQGYYYVGEYGEYDRIQKLAPDGQFVLQWGGHGSAPGQFIRPQSLALDEQENLWVADACNHRIQVFDRQGRLLRLWGREGSGLGELYYPYDLALGPDDTVYVVEWGNDRVQKFTREGRPLGIWGARGRAEGQLANPWAVVRDSQGRLHVLDTDNHRVQTIRM